MDRDSVVIEVGLNEAVMRNQAPHVAYTPSECAADAATCAGAGAALVHWHARDPVTGVQRLADAALYAEGMESMPTADVIGAAVMVGRIATGEIEDTPSLAPNRAVGGRIGGKVRAESLSPERKSDIAKKAAKGRWNKG